MATEEDQFYWHTVYKISDLLSPREDSKSFNDDSKTEDTPNKRLTLLTGNMGAEEEISLRSLLMLKKDLWFIKGEAESIVSLLDADEALQDTQSQLYCRAIFSKFSGELDYLICFLSASKSGLELFQTDLDKFSSKLIPHLEKYTESNDTNEYWKEFEDWPKSVLSFVKECLATFDYDLATLLCAGFCGDTVIINDSVPKDVKKNLERFLQCCSLSALFSETKLESKASSPTSSLTDLISLQNPEKIHVELDSNGQYIVNPKKPSTFCNDCVKQLKVNQNIDMVHMRQMLENFKLKSIQDMNTFRRLLTQAEVDFYACYKTYLFLLTSGNGLVLMRNSRLQNNMDPTVKRQEVLDTLEQFITKMGGFGTFDTKEQKEILTNKTGSLRYH